MTTTKRLPKRTDVATADTWDLASLFPNDEAWEAEFTKWEKRIGGYSKFAGKLGTDAKVLAACLKFDLHFERQGERLGNYAFLKTAEDQAEDNAQRKISRFQNVATRAAQAASFIRPELMALSAATVKRYLSSKELQPYRLLLDRILRFKKYTLSESEEKLLAMQGEMAEAAGKAFRQLLDADLKFGFIENEKGEKVELGNASYIQMLNCPKRSVREKAFHQYYEQFKAHENTLAAMLGGSIQKDVYYARARGYDSALSAALFPDNMPHSVYDNLIASVRQHLPAVHRYYDVRKRKMRLKEIHQFDTYVPILSKLEKRHTWAQAVDAVVESLSPLGDEYCSTLRAGLSGRWCDRYPNQGKQSGAFSAGGYDGDPYILMNFKPDLLDEVFTLSHEAGHSMHSYYSAHNQPYQYYQYAIFVAEVASTFNEQLLTKYFLDRASGKEERAYLINNAIDDIRGTIVRQTMFAEFEKETHAMAEAGEPLTVKSLQETYRKLLEAYFGPAFKLDDELSLECFRIPHFYRAFYVYKYATGLSAAIALSQRVLNGGKPEVTAYLNFLKSGCCKFPLDLLRDAGVDMESPKPVDLALLHFSALVKELDELL